MTKTKGTRVGLKDVASAAGVSVAAASMALAGSQEIGERTRKRVEACCRELGYRRPQRRQRKNQECIGFVLVGKRFEDMTVVPFLDGLSLRLSGRSSRLELLALPDEMPGPDRKKALEQLEQTVDAMLVTGTVDSELLQDINKPHSVVVLGGLNQNLPVNVAVPSIVGDNIAMGRAATKHLLSHGHHHIGFVAQRMPEGMYSAEWYDGYRLALADAGLEPPPLTIAAGDALAEGFAQMPESPTAYVIPDANTILSFIAAMRALDIPVGAENVVLGGRLPGGMPFGIDDYPLIVEDAQAMVDTALGLATRPVTSRALALERVIVPHLTKNLVVNDGHP